MVCTEQEATMFCHLSLLKNRSFKGDLGSSKSFLGKKESVLLYMNS